jgi:hypothetical protein
VNTPAAIVAAIAATVACGGALGAPHPEPCKRIPSYEESVERILRAAWPQQLELLAIMYGVPLTERGIALERTESGFNLIRLELDKSFWYSSWRELGQGDSPNNGAAVATEVYRQDGRRLGGQVLDFSKTTVAVAKSSVPISEKLGVAVLKVFERHAANARVPGPVDEILLDGYTFEILLSERPCVALKNPPRESEAYRMDRLVRLLDGKVPTWRPAEREAFEAELLAAVSAVD